MLREHQLLAGRSSSLIDPPAPFLCCQEPRGCPRTGDGRRMSGGSFVLAEPLGPGRSGFPLCGVGIVVMVDALRGQAVR
jgi:hypothetical protein